MKFIDINDNIVTKPADAPIKKKTSAYGLLIVGQFILLTQDLGVSFKEIPGGTIENGEDELMGLTREVKEETGLSVHTKSPEPIATKTELFYYNITDTYYESTRKVYLVELSDSTIDIEHVFAGEIASVGFYNIDTIDDVELQEFIRTTITEHIKD